MARQGPSGHKQMDDRRLDDTVIDSFPASDPPSYSGITGIGRPHDPGQASEQERRAPSELVPPDLFGRDLAGYRGRGRA